MLKYASFFSGALGLDLGLEMAGWQCGFANEIDKVACQTIRLNRPDLNLFEGDIRTLNSAQLGGLKGLELIVGGPPCQAFSTAGKRLGLNDERGNVFLHFLDIATELKPTMIVIENVRGLLSAPLLHRPHSQRGFGFDPLSESELPGGAFAHVVATLKAASYQVSYGLYDVADFGIPQHRQRLLIFAHISRVVPPMQPTHGERLPHLTFKDVVSDLTLRHQHSDLRDSQSEYVQMLRPGQNWRNLPEKLQRKALGNAFECSGGRTGFLRRLAWDKPAPTLMTSPTMPATLLAHPVENRPLSVQEYARIQTFPDDWVFAGKLAQIYRQLGNAVPVLFGKVLGEHLVQFVKS